MTQATVLGQSYFNSNLFSSYYLDERLIDRAEWNCDDEAREAMEDLQELYDLEEGLVSGYGEDALIDNWIDEVLDILGFGTQEEVTLPDGSGFVDELLFENPTARRNAAEVYLDTENTIDLFERGTGIVEAKQWEADFNSRFSERRPYRNASHQIKHYLENTPGEIRWGVLTNGRKWRLYGTKDYETQTYYEVDLPELLREGNLTKFKYFYVFFRSAAFKTTRGTTFHEEVWAESETASEQLGEDLQDNVFTALRVLGRGFVETNDLNIDPEDSESLDELKQKSLVLLYRLMFVLYAESRSLIHPEDQSAQDEYEENFGIETLRLDIHETIGEIDEGFDVHYSEHSTSMWSRLQDLFRLIDQGQEELGVPPYNGGLFDEDEHSFLSENEVSDRYLGEVIYRLSTTRNEQGRYVLADYADLSTRHLGSVYEGLLEHHFKLAPEQYAAVADDGGQAWEPATEVSAAEAVEVVDEGELYVVNDEGERKSAGAYYTPDHVVSYIVEETVEPLVDGIRHELVNQGFEPGTQEYLGPFLRRITDLKILDPAMGSAHFLTSATRYLSEQVMEEVRDTESEMGVAFDEQHVRREIAKECIYGVDKNGMAVELGKLAMWLETLAADQPLAFLDHHFKQGDSLIGSDINDVLASDNRKTTGQLTLTDVFEQMRQQALEQVMDLFKDLVSIENENLEDIKQMEQIYERIQHDPQYQRLLKMANVYAANEFGHTIPNSAFQDMAEALRDDEWESKIEGKEWFEDAQSLANEEDFFHWELEFPSAFYTEEGEQRENGGFDAVIGNPPWLNAWSMTDKMPELRDGIKSIFSETEILSGHWDLYIPFVINSLNLCREGGNHSFILPNTVLTEKYARNLREHLLRDEDLNSILDFGERDVFNGVDRQVVVYNVTKSDSEKEISLRVCDSDSPFEYREVATSEPGLWLDVYNHQIRIDPDYISDALPLIRKIDEETIPLGNYFYVNVGATVSSEESGEFSKSDVVSDSPEGNAKKFSQGTDLKRWSVEWSGDWLDYRYEEMSGPRTAEMFNSDKLVVRKRTDEGGVVAAGFDDEGLFCDDTVIVCCPYEQLEGTSANTEFGGFERMNKDLDMRYVVSVINSSLITWVFKNKFETGALQGSYSDVWPQSVRSFPLPRETEAVENVEIWKEEASDIAGGNRFNDIEEVEGLLAVLSEEISDRRRRRRDINLNLVDYLGEYPEGKSLSDLSPIPPEGRRESVLMKKDGESERFAKIRATEAAVEREDDTVLVKLTPYVKPKEEYRDQYELNRNYATLSPEPAMRFSSVEEEMALLIEAFVPYAVQEAGGFANYYDNAVTTKSLIDRLRELTLPDVEAISDELVQYRQNRRRAMKLDAEVSQLIELIDRIVYELYNLTDEEQAIVDGSLMAE